MEHVNCDRPIRIFGKGISPMPGVQCWSWLANSKANEHGDTITITAEMHSLARLQSFMHKLVESQGLSNDGGFGQVRTLSKLIDNLHLAGRQV